MKNPVDSLIAFVDPSRGLKRVEARTRLAMIDGAMGESTGYLTAGAQKRSLRGWFTSLLSPDSEILPKAKSARASSRDLYMNTPLASAILKRIDTNTIGHGLTLQSRIEREALAISDEEADAWERKTEMLFRIYASSKNCDIARQLNFYQLQSLAFMSPLMSGDVFFMLPWKAVNDWPFELRIKLIEADLCSNPNDSLDTGTLAGGIEVDEDGAPIRYHFCNRFPLQNDIIDFRPRAWKAIDAYDVVSGRQNIYHLFEKTRPGQRRGMPFLAPVFEVLKQTSRLTEAKLMQNLIQTFFTVFVKDSKGPVSLQPNFAGANSILANQQEDPDIENKYELGNANIVELDDSKDIVVADPNRTDTAFEPFFAAMVKMLSAACEIPYEQLLLHFSASYSASRAALLEAWKFYRKKRANFAFDFNQPIYNAWLFEMVYKGIIKAPGFLEDPITRQFWCKAKWGGAGQGQIDPAKETAAAVEKINNNLSNHEDEFTLIYGGDWEATFARKVREDKLIRANGQTPPEQAAVERAQVSTNPPSDSGDEAP
jgi:lambda family phage portal protein